MLGDYQEGICNQENTYSKQNSHNIQKKKKKKKASVKKKWFLGRYGFPYILAIFA